MDRLTNETVEIGTTKIIETLKQRLVEKRLLAYIKKVIRNSPEGVCFVSQAVICRTLGVRKQSVSDGCRNICDRGDLIRMPVDNRNRPNQKYYYFLPDAELLGNSKESSFSKKEDVDKAKPKFTDEEVPTNEVVRAPIDTPISFAEVGSWTASDRMKLIEKYCDAGLMVTPLVEKGKVPPKGWTKDYVRTLPKNELLDFFTANPKLNVGCWMPANFVVVDADDLESFYELTCGETWDTLTATTARGKHFWFRHAGNIGSGNGIRENLDYKAEGSLVVLPPSVHKSGALYRWDNLAAPSDAPKLVQELYETREHKREPIYPNASRRIQPLLTSNTVLSAGDRYDRLFRFGRHLRLRLNAEEVKAELVGYNQQCCRPPLDHRRMQKLIHDVFHAANQKEFAKAV